jgi:hypothetical protein
MTATPTCADPSPVVRAIPTEQLTGMHRVPHADQDGETFLLVELSLADTPTAAADESLMGLTATIGIGVTATAVAPPIPSSTPEAPTTAAGSTPTPSPRLPRTEGSLPYTGGAILGPVLLAAALVLTGVTVRLRRQARS